MAGGTTVSIDPLIDARPAGGDELAELYRRHARRLVGLAAAVTLDRSVADEVVHDAFARLAPRLAGLRDPVAFLQRSVVHLGIRVVLRRERADTQPRRPIEHSSIPEVDELWAQVRGLPVHQRAMVVLRFWDGLTHNRTAEVLDLPVGTVTSTLQRALRTIRGAAVNAPDELTALEDRLGGALRRCLIVVLDPAVGQAPAAIGRTPGDGTPAGDGAATDRPSIDPQHTSRRRLAAAAAVVVLVGAGAFAWSGSRDPGVRSAQTGLDGTGADPDGTGVGAAGSLPTVTSAVAEPTPTLVLAGLDGLVWVPTVEPAGFRLTSVSVTRSARVFDRPAERYVRRAADGSTVAAWVELVAAPLRRDDATEGTETGDDTATGTDGPTVHGQPADVVEVQSGQWHVTWRESGLLLSVRAGGLDRATVLQLAESTVVDARESALRLSAAPPGFEAPNVVVAPDGAPTTSYSWLPDAATAGVYVDVVARPNTGRHTLDTLQATSSTDGWEHTRIVLDRGNADPLPAWVATSPPTEFGRLITITWIEGPYVLSVGGRVDLDQLRAVAGGLVAASLPDVRALRTRVDAEALELPELDRATTPSEVVVSVRTTGSGANVVCVEAPFARCRYTTGESSPAGDEQTAVVETFTVDGATWVVGWAQGDHVPRMVVDGVSQSLADVGVGSAGTFFVVRDAVAEASFVFDEDDRATGPVFAAAASLDADLLE